MYCYDGINLWNFLWKMNDNVFTDYLNLLLLLIVSWHIHNLIVHRNLVVVYWSYASYADMNWKIKETMILNERLLGKAQKPVVVIAILVLNLAFDLAFETNFYYHLAEWRYLDDVWILFLWVIQDQDLKKVKMMLSFRR